MIRKVEENDLNKGLTEVFIEGFRFHYNARPDIFTNKTDEELKQELIKLIMNDNILVIEEDDNIIGYIDYEIRDKHAKVMWVDQIIISEKSRGKGYGKELLNKIFEIAKQENCDRIELECWSFNDNAINMYKHLGFSNQRVKMDMKLR